MRLAKPTAALLLVAGSHFAQAAPAAVGTTKGAAAPIKPVAVPTATEIKDVGVPGAKRGEGGLTISEFQRLQEAVELKKLRDAIEPADGELKISAPSGKAVVPPAPAQPKAEPAPPMPSHGVPPAVQPPAHFSTKLQTHQTAEGTTVALGMWAPSGKWVRTMVIGGASFADVEVDGRVQRYKEGEAIGAWVVRRVSADGVWVERQLPSVMQRTGEHVSQVDERTGQARVMTLKLPSGYVANTADAQAVESRPRVPVLPPAAPVAAPGRPDSTSLQTFPPLPVR